MSAEGVSAFEMTNGAHPRYLDAATMRLDVAAAQWRRLQENRQRYAQYEIDPTCKGCRDGIVLPAKAHKEFCVVAALALAESRAQARLIRLLRAHPLWPWLSGFPGLGGGHVALVIGRVGDPRRFPGQRCSEGHYLPAGVYPAGSPCPVADSRAESVELFGDGADSESAESRAEIEAHRGGLPVSPLAESWTESERTAGDGGHCESADHDPASVRVSGGLGLPPADDLRCESVHRAVCRGFVLPPRPGSGSRSLWHYAGLAPGADGRSMRKRKGVACSWNPEARASVLQPGGIAEQIVRLRVPVYADMVVEKKKILSLRLADSLVAIVAPVGGAEEERTPESITEIGGADGRPLRPFEVDRIARKYAAKQFLADMLAEWKRLAATDVGPAAVQLNERAASRGGGADAGEATYSAAGSSAPAA